jgi:large subunit ribosomal protein L31
MKKDIHPKYTALKIKIAKDSFDTMSTHGGEILMDVDFRTHPAWTGKGVSSANESNKTISAFNDKFAGISFM